jgi:hypothetical protein
VVASGLVGCEAGTSSGGGCFVGTTTSPDWVFGLLMSSGLVALTSGMVWVVLVAIRPTTPIGPRRTAARTRLYVVAVLAWLGVNAYHYRDLWTRAPDGYILAVSVTASALTVVVLVVAAHRFRTTGVWPGGRRAPWGAFWLLPTMCASAIGVAGWSLVTMVASSVTTSKPC